MSMSNKTEIAGIQTERLLTVTTPKKAMNTTNLK